MAPADIKRNACPDFSPVNVSGARQSTVLVHTERTAVSLALVALLTSGCGALRDDVEPQEDDALSAQIRQVNRPGGERRLKDMAPGDWDTVHIFGEYDSRDEIEKEVGTKVDMGESIESTYHLLFFMKDGKLLRATKTRPSNLVPGTYGADLVLRGRAAPGSTVLDLATP